jgi:coproporphyrinogen III oxidase-like Fe-S oxidoreductase
VEIVNERSARREEIMLGLRTDRGIGGAGLELSAGTLEAWVRQGWLRITGDRLSLTDVGMLLSNELISTLMP